VRRPSPEGKPEALDGSAVAAVPRVPGEEADAEEQREPPRREHRLRHSRRPGSAWVAGSRANGGGEYRDDAREGVASPSRNAINAAPQRPRNVGKAEEDARCS